MPQDQMRLCLNAITKVLDQVRRDHGQESAEAMADFHVRSWQAAKDEQLALGVPYYHGGAPGLRVGERVLPSSVTGTEHVMSRYVRGTPDFDRLQVTCRDHVYFSSARDLAVEYAAVYPDGGFYRIAPEGDFEPDPDCGIPGLAWRCSAATVVEVVHAEVRLQRSLTLKQIDDLCGLDSPMGARVVAILRKEGRLGHRRPPART
ncbi:hypothetical protein QA942_10275 [Streptomyces sp. B21-106]|uniref:hypothetical protein n=1 Tax=Streptomyces sp. B21-106 TaxID=3039418 RepID=UPI002FEEEECA